MPKGSRIIALFLMAALVAILPGATAFAVPNAPTTHPPGCHGHQSPASDPGPTSYRCCVAGHQPAVQGTSFSAAIFIPNLGNVAATVPTTGVCGGHLSRPMSSSFRPPGLTPIRI